MFAVATAAYFAESDVLVVIIDSPFVHRYRPQTFAELETWVDTDQSFDPDGHKLLAVNWTSIRFLWSTFKTGQLASDNPAFHVLADLRDLPLTIR